MTRYDDVVAVLKDTRVSSRRPTADERVPRSLAAIADQLRELRAFQSRWVLYLDPPVRLDAWTCELSLSMTHPITSESSGPT